MSIVFACPGCGKKFKVENDKAGRKGKCPDCGRMFQIPAAKTVAVAAEPEPNAYLVAVEQARPEPEEDRSSRKSRENEDGTPKPRAPKRKKHRKKDDSYAMVIGSIIGAVAVLLLVVIGVGVMLWIHHSGSFTDDLRFLPDNPEFVLMINTEALTKGAAYQQIPKESSPFNDIEQQLRTDFGIDFSEVRRVTRGGSAASSVTVVRTKNALDDEALLTRGRRYYQESSVGGYTVNDGTFGSLCIAGRKTLVTGERAAVHPALERNAKAALSAGMQAAIKQANLAKGAVVFVDLQRLMQRSPIPIDPAMPAGVANFLTALSQAETMVLEVDVTAHVALALSMYCKDSAAAEKLKSATEDFLKVVNTLGPLAPADLVNALKGMQLSVADNKVTAQLTLAPNSLSAVIKQAPLPKRGG